VCVTRSGACSLLQQGESPANVQRQLGHAPIQLTMNTYGKWRPMGATRPPSTGSTTKVVAKRQQKRRREPSGMLEMPVNIDGPSRIRTLDPLIKRWSSDRCGDAMVTLRQIATAARCVLQRRRFPSHRHVRSERVRIAKSRVDLYTCTLAR